MSWRRSSLRPRRLLRRSTSRGRSRKRLAMVNWSAWRKRGRGVSGLFSMLRLLVRVCGCRFLSIGDRWLSSRHASGIFRLLETFLLWAGPFVALVMAVARCLVKSLHNANDLYDLENGLLLLVPASCAIQSSRFFAPRTSSHDTRVQNPWCLNRQMSIHPRVPATPITGTLSAPYMPFAKALTPYRRSGHISHYGHPRVGSGYSRYNQITAALDSIRFDIFVKFISIKIHGPISFESHR